MPVMLSCYQCISYSTVLSVNTNTGSIARRAIFCVLSMLFIIHDNYCVFMHLVRRYAHFCTRQINLHKRMMQPPTPLKTFSLTKPTNMNHQWVFPRRGEMVALPEVSALVAVERRPKEASCVHCYCAIHETTIHLLVVKIHCKYPPPSINLDWLRANHPEVDDRWSRRDTSDALRVVIFINAMPILSQPF